MTGPLIPFLSMLTLLAVATFALVSKARTEDRRRDPNAPVSTLARDGKFGGIAFLIPLSQRLPRPYVATDRWAPGRF